MGACYVDTAISGATPGKKAVQQEQRAVHVVFTATVELATMKRSDQRVIGVYADLKEAEALETKFNENEQKMTTS